MLYYIGKYFRSDSIQNNRIWIKRIKNKSGWRFERRIFNVEFRFLYTFWVLPMLAGEIQISNAQVNVKHIEFIQSGWRQSNSESKIQFKMLKYRKQMEMLHWNAYGQKHIYTRQT